MMKVSLSEECLASKIGNFLVEQSRRDTFDVRVAILMLAVYSVSIFFIDTWVGMGLYALVLTICCIYMCQHGLNLKRMFCVGIPVYVIALITVICNIFVYTNGAISPSFSGFLRGVFFSLRMLLLVWASLAVCLSVDLTRIEHAFASLLSPLRKIKVPVDDIACVLSIALRFIPATFDEFVSIKAAQWSRGADFDEGFILKRLMAYISIFAPLLISLFRSADRLSLAMDARCYGATSAARTNLYEKNIPVAQIIVMFAFCALCISSALML